jgi:hypothetical protein
VGATAAILPTEWCDDHVSFWRTVVWPSGLGDSDQMLDLQGHQNCSLYIFSWGYVKNFENTNLLYEITSSTKTDRSYAYSFICFFIFMFVIAKYRCAVK